MVNYQEHKIRGKYYGYPDCCVDFFSYDEEILEVNKTRYEELGDIYELFVTAFCVPCPKCYAALLRNKEQTLKAFTIKDRFKKIRKVK